MNLDFKSWLETATSTGSVAVFARPIGDLRVPYPWNVQDPFFKKKKKKLNEMPLSSYGSVVDPNVPVSKNQVAGLFNTTDRSLIKSVLQNKLEKILKKSPYQWNVIFFENTSLYKDKLNKYISDNNIVVPGHITFVKTDSSGHPLTPWMTLHTVGHALDNSVPGYNQFTSYLRELSAKLNEIQNNAFFKPGEDYNSDRRRTEKDQKVVLSLTQLFNFQSALNAQIWHKKYNNLSEKQKGRIAEDRVSDIDELSYEIIALYLYKGKVDLELNLLYQAKPSDIIDLIGEAEIKINIIINSILSEAVGKVIID